MEHLLRTEVRIPTPCPERTMPPFRRGAILGLLVLSACVHRYYEVEDGPLDVPREEVLVDAVLRAHLADGGVVLFRSGAMVSPFALTGHGVRYDLSRTDSAVVDEIRLDSVVGVESFRQDLQAGKTVLMSTGATLSAASLAVAGLLVMACAADPKCFGSCPTVYSETPDGEILDAELFSYSIAPLLEGRDVDALRSRAQNGVVRLDVRNEALETHSINHLQLLEVLHDSDDAVAPDVDGIPVAWRHAAGAVRAVDGAGRSVERELAAADGDVFSTAPGHLASASPERLDDHLELVFLRPAGDSAALVLELRNSLLNTVLFYDVMLGAAGAHALTWMADDLHRIGDAVRLGRWWSRRMGLHIEVWDAGAWRGVRRLPDSGPLAWSEAAVTIPLPDADERGEIRIRLRFPLDAWRIDRVALAPFHRPFVRTVPAARVLDGAEAPLPAALQAVLHPDEEYLETVAGQRFAVEFDVGPDPDSLSRSFLLSSQGYYTEWVRPAWIRAPEPQETFSPSDIALLEAMRRWGTAREEFEARFYATRIPVR
jgi:hypothetical protein